MARLWLILGLILLSFTAAQAAEPALPELAAIRSVGAKGEGHAEAIAAVKKLQQADAKHLIEVLQAIDGASPLAQNWLRGVAEAMAQREIAATGKLPADKLE